MTNIKDLFPQQIFKLSEINLSFRKRAVARQFIRTILNKEQAKGTKTSRRLEALSLALAAASDKEVWTWCSAFSNGRLECSRQAAEYSGSFPLGNLYLQKSDQLEN